VGTRDERNGHRAERNGCVKSSCSIKELMSILGLNYNSYSLGALDYIRETGGCGINSIDLTQNRDQWRALVNTVMNFRVP
jgi:hypothetical protein